MEKTQETALTQLRESFKKLGISTENYGDPTLMRFLIARSMEPEKAGKMFVRWHKWRSDLVPNGFIAESQIPDELECKDVFLQGLSRNGHPVLVVKASKHFPSKDQEQFKKFVVYLLDKAISSSFKGKEIGNEKVIVILDLEKLSYKNVDVRGFITGLQIVQDYYPERLAMVYLLHIPRFFAAVWKMICRYADKATLQKIVTIVSNEDKRRGFVQEIGKQTLPEEFGGQAKLMLIQDVVLPPLEN